MLRWRQLVAWEWDARGIIAELQGRTWLNLALPCLPTDVWRGCVAILYGFADLRTRIARGHACLCWDVLLPPRSFIQAAYSKMVVPCSVALKQTWIDVLPAWSRLVVQTDSDTSDSSLVSQ